VIVDRLETPYLLLAAPDLLDPNFARTVVLMGHHTLEGAIGWIVNRVLDRSALGELPPLLTESIHQDTPLRLGGPVLTNGLIVVYRDEILDVDSIEMSPGIRVSSTPDVLPRLFGEQPSGVPRGLLVFGYAGWGPGQLEHEMAQGSWLVLPYNEPLAFPENADELWERAMAELGVKPENVITTPGMVN